MLDEWLKVWCSSPLMVKDSGEGGGWPDTALASRSALIGAPGASLAAPDSRRFAARATDGVWSLWRCAATEAWEALGSETQSHRSISELPRHSTLNGFSPRTDMSTRVPKTMRITGILNCRLFVFKNTKNVGCFSCQDLLRC